MRIAFTRVRNEEEILEHTLNSLQYHFDGVYVYDDCSTDRTVQLAMDHPLVKGVVNGNKVWERDPNKRYYLESIHRDLLYRYILDKEKNVEWMLYFDGDEIFHFDEIIWDDLGTYYFRLFDVYITPEDVDKHFMKREWIGAGYRDIPMLFRPNKNVFFQGRYPKNADQPYLCGGTVKHFGKAISEKQWEDTCDYYINHLHEPMLDGTDISDKWRKRKGKAVHDYVDDWGNELINWNERYHPDKIYKIH